MQNEIPLGLSYDDVLLVPQYSEINSRSDVDLTTKITPKITLKLPLISINMSDVTGVEMAITLGKLGGLGFLPRFETPAKQADMVSAVKKKGHIAAAAIGCRDGYKDRAEQLVKAGVDILTIDVAHGAMKMCIDATSYLKNKHGKSVEVISGVIATYEGADALFKAGADSVRVGVGPGTICVTRIVTGVGVPQITAVLQAAKAARKHKKTILCDGGTKNTGDIVKGLAAGASAVVIGSQFAGTDEAPGKIIGIDGKMFKQYNASTSLSEKKTHTKKLKDVGLKYTKYIEGVESVVTYKGPVVGVVERMKYALSSGLSYCGAKNILDLWERAKFVRVSPHGAKENGSHDVVVV